MGTMAFEEAVVSIFYGIFLGKLQKKSHSILP